jgi:hypothetical protein
VLVHLTIGVELALAGSLIGKGEEDMQPQDMQPQDMQPQDMQQQDMQSGGQSSPLQGRRETDLEQIQVQHLQSPAQTANTPRRNSPRIQPGRHTYI